MKVFRGRVHEEDEPGPMRKPPAPPCSIQHKPDRAASAAPPRRAAFPEHGARATVHADSSVVVVTLPVLSAGLRVCELTVRIDEARQAEISWDGRPFARARWVGSGLSHVYALAGGPVVPPAANATDQQTIERALLEIEIAAQSAVRAMSPPPRAPVRDQERKPERAPLASPREEPPPTSTGVVAGAWQEPSSEDDAAARRHAVVLAMSKVDTRLQGINAVLPGTSGAARASLTRERALLAQEKSRLVHELQQLKFWMAQNGSTATSNNKVSLWDVLRKCHRVLERISPEAPAFADDIEMCLDAIEYVLPRSFLGEPEAPPTS